MFRRLACLLLAAAVLGLGACASGPSVRTDHDPSASFEQYRSWGFYQPIAMEQAGYSSWISERIRADVRKEMESRGYHYAAQGADLLVNFQGVVQEKTAVWSVPRSNVEWFYSYRHRSYVAVPVWYDETQVSRYKEGTLTVDLVDGKQNRMVWTGAASSTVAGKRKPEQRLADIDQAIAAIFAKYPHKAGAQ
ncbi:DUF4136 domain-containing protein [Thermomonas paludicola]|uniref:DUF4136 domain-containing protein n=1 Tax=Thermomonas paludicola TaxID=2884874 RepID=UPI0021155595|nr:DUF4136 domain-containing protein [Thermomonas paludicola]